MADYTIYELVKYAEGLSLTNMSWDDFVEKMCSHFDIWVWEESGMMQLRFVWDYLNEKCDKEKYHDIDLRARYLSRSIEDLLKREPKTVLPTHVINGILLKYGLELSEAYHEAMREEEEL